MTLLWQVAFRDLTISLQLCDTGAATGKPVPTKNGMK